MASQGGRWRYPLIVVLGIISIGLLSLVGSFLAAYSMYLRSRGQNADFSLICAAYYVILIEPALIFAVLCRITNVKPRGKLPMFCAAVLITMAFTLSEDKFLATYAAPTIDCHYLETTRPSWRS